MGIESNVEIPPNENSEAANDTVQNGREKGKDKKSEPNERWPDHFNTVLTPFLSDEAIAQVKKMFLEGPEPPRVSDSGWGSRQPRTSEDVDAVEGAEASNVPEPSQGVPEKEQKGQRGKERGGKGGRGSRGGRGGGRGGRAGGREDSRKVLSNVRHCLLDVHHSHFLMTI